MASIKLGELLIKANVLKEDQLKAALSEQQKWGGKLGDILIRMNIIAEDMIVRALAKQLNIPPVNLDAVQGIPPHVKQKIPAATAKELEALPIQLRDDSKTLVVAMAEPQNIQALDTLRAVSKCRIVPNIAGRSSIQRAFGKFYEGEADISDYEGSFKVVDSQGRTMVKALPRELQEKLAKEPGTPARTASLSDVPAAAARSGPPPPPVAASGNPSDLLRAVEEVQRKEVAALKAMVELMIEKGVFSRDEYLAKVKR